MKVTKFHLLKTEAHCLEHHEIMPYREILIIISD